MRSGAHSQRHFERERLAGQSGAGWPPIPERHRRRNLGLMVGAALLLVSALVIAVNALAGAPGREALVATTSPSQNLAGAPRQEALVATTGASQNLVANGGFESGTASWTVSDLKHVTSPTHSVQLCGYTGCMGDLSQAVRLPTPAKTLTFGYWILVQPGGSTSVACSASVQATLRTTSGGVITTVGTTCSSAPSGAWTWVHADVSAPLAGYAGKKVSVRFHCKSGRGDDTRFVVDDVLAGYRDHHDAGCRTDRDPCSKAERKPEDDSHSDDSHSDDSHSGGCPDADSGSGRGPGRTVDSAARQCALAVGDRPSARPRQCERHGHRGDYIQRRRRSQSCGI